MLKACLLTSMTLLAALPAFAEPYAFANCSGGNQTAILSAADMGSAVTVELMDVAANSTLFQAALTPLTAADFQGQVYVQLPASSTLAQLSDGLTLSDVAGSDRAIQISLKQDKLSVSGDRQVEMTCVPVGR